MRCATGWPSVDDTYYMIGTVAGPHPYPAMVRDFQNVIGEEARVQIMQSAEGRLPDTLVACIGGGSNAMGLFYPFLDDASVKIIGVEAAVASASIPANMPACSDRRHARRPAWQSHLSAANR